MLPGQNHFYVTESAPHRHKIFYYRREVWQRVFALAVSELIDGNGTYRAIATVEARELLASTRTLGFSYVRFLPKENGVRPIVNMRRAQRVALRHLAAGLHGERPGGLVLTQPSINSALQNVFQVLCYEKQKAPSKLGATVFGQDDIYVRLKGFRLRYQELRTARGRFGVFLGFETDVNA